MYIIECRKVVKVKQGIEQFFFRKSVNILDISSEIEDTLL